jgi:hypothetical protein
MKRGDWIVCERTSRWAAGLRIAADRHAITAKSQLRVVEVRSLVELAARLDELPTALALVEVRRENFAPVLAWLPDAQARHPYARFYALLDHPPATENENWPATPVGENPDVASVLVEAGAVGVADSPRHLHDVLSIAERHRALVAVDSSSSACDQPLLEWAKSLLPWQDG